MGLAAVKPNTLLMSLIESFQAVVGSGETSMPSAFFWAPIDMICGFISIKIRNGAMNFRLKRSQIVCVSVVGNSIDAKSLLIYGADESFFK
jgi:hypothetical protein